MATIIFPVDFSEKTSLLVEKAVKFAKMVNGKIHVIHVAPADIGFAIGDMGYQYIPELEQHEMNEELKLLLDIQNKITEQGVSCDHFLKQGIAKDIIMDVAHEKNADFIIMGSHGRSGMYDVFVGSLTKTLTKTSDIPVLVIPVHE